MFSLRKVNTAQGSAIITALLITTIVAAIATVMALRQQVEIQDLSLALEADRNELALQSTVLWAKHELSKPLPKIEYQFKPDSFYPENLHADIIDAQGLFNINSLQNANNEIFLSRLIVYVDPQITPADADKLAANVHGWFSKAPTAIPQNPVPPYRASGMLMASISELRLVAGFTPQLLAVLLPYLTVLPNAQFSINPTRMAGPLFAIFTNQLSPERTKILVDCQQTAPGFTTPTDVVTCFKRAGITLDQNTMPPLTFTSQYFLLASALWLPHNRLHLYTLLERLQSNPTTVTVKVLSTFAYQL